MREREKKRLINQALVNHTASSKQTSHIRNQLDGLSAEKHCIIPLLYPHHTLIRTHTHVCSTHTCTHTDTQTHTHTHTHTHKHFDIHRHRRFISLSFSLSLSLSHTHTNTHTHTHTGVNTRLTCHQHNYQRQICTDTYAIYHLLHIQPSFAMPKSGGFRVTVMYLWVHSRSQHPSCSLSFPTNLIFLSCLHLIRLFLPPNLGSLFISLSLLHTSFLFLYISYCFSLTLPLCLPLFLVRLLSSPVSSHNSRVNRERDNSTSITVCEGLCRDTGQCFKEPVSLTISPLHVNVSV